MMTLAMSIKKAPTSGTMMNASWQAPYRLVTADIFRTIVNYDFGLL